MIIASGWPHADRSSVERYILKISAVRRKIEAARREMAQRELDEVRKEVLAKRDEREPPPRPSPPPPPVPAGSIRYEIETRAPIEVVETVYPDYREGVRRQGAAGTIAAGADV